MNCPKCKGRESIVYRTIRETDRIVRERKCKSCDYQYETIEANKISNWFLQLKEAESYCKNMIDEYEALLSYLRTCHEKIYRLLKD